MLSGSPVIARGNRRGHSRDPCPFGHRSSPEAPSLRRHYPVVRASPPLPRRNLLVLASLASRQMAAFPDFTAGRLPHCAVRGLLGGPLRRSASDDVVTSIIRSDCYRLERQLPGGIRTR